MPNENHKPDQPLDFGCNNLLGPLPEPAMKSGPGSMTRRDYFSADQMRAYAAQEVAAERARRLPDVDELAQHIRWLNGSNKMGAGRLAEKLVDWLRSRA